MSASHVAKGLLNFPGHTITENVEKPRSETNKTQQNHSESRWRKGKHIVQPLEVWVLKRATPLSIPGPNLDTEMSVEFSVAFYSSTLHIYYLSLYWPDLKR